MQPEVCFLRWRPPNRKYLYLSFQTRYQRRSNGYPPFSGSWASTGQMYTVRRNLVWMLRYKYFRFGGRHLVNRFPVTSDTIRNSANGLLDPENGGLAVGTALLSCLEAELQLIPVCMPPSLKTDFRLHRTLFAIVPMGCWTPKMGVSRWNGVAILSRS